MATKVTKAAGAAIGSALLAATPIVSEAIPETEVNDTFPGQSATAGVTFEGVVSKPFDPVEPPPPDPVDYYRYTGLTPGYFFDVFVDIVGSGDRGPLDVSVLQGTLPETLIIGTTISGVEPLNEALLVGLVPASGELVVKIALPLLDGGFNSGEDYQLTLTTRAAVPLPASIALAAAGLVGLGGLHVARRRRAA